MPEPQLNDPPSGDALAPSIDALKTIMLNEESRFNNLNSRAISLLAATSLITTLAGFFSKDLLGASLGGAVKVVAATLLVALLGLLLTAGFLVLGVLLPTRRALFGDNSIMDCSGTLTSAGEVQGIVFSEFRAILLDLRERNGSKARYLHRAYIFFVLTVLSIAVGPAAVALPILF